MLERILSAAHKVTKTISLASFSADELLSHIPVLATHIYFKDVFKFSLLVSLVSFCCFVCLTVLSCTCIVVLMYCMCLTSCVLL